VKGANNPVDFRLLQKRVPLDGRTAEWRSAGDDLGRRRESCTPAPKASQILRLHNIRKRTTASQAKFFFNKD